jgi:Peptidase family S41/N-terminal domain of Peptidase_S41 in eukaryotic IRBP
MRDERVPSFQTLGAFRPRTVAVIHGLLLSMAVFSVICYAFRYSSMHVLHMRMPEIQFDRLRSSSPSFEPTVQPNDGSVASAMSQKAAVPPRWDNKTPSPPSAAPQSSFNEPAQASGPIADQNSVALSSAAASAKSHEGSKSSSRLRRQRVIDAAAKNLRQYYAYPDVGQKMADSLLAHEKKGDDDTAADGAAFADLLTKQMREVSHDRHLELVYSQDPLPASRFDALGRPLGPTPDDHARYRKIMEQENCTFEKTETLVHNIGYLKLNSFPDPSICGPTAVTAMASLNHVDAIIFDLRNNRGGEPEMVALIAAYLFDRPEYWYNPRENTTPRSWKQSPVPGNRLADKPVYVLTSTRTFSGAEQFSYDLKMLKRAILVGETTGGAAHSGVFYRIDDHFGIGIPETKPINPFSKTDWAETGVEPDVTVKAAEALETAVKLAQSKLQKK